MELNSLLEPLRRFRSSSAITLVTSALVLVAVAAIVQRTTTIALLEGLSRTIGLDQVAMLLDRTEAALQNYVVAEWVSWFVLALHVVAAIIYTSAVVRQVELDREAARAVNVFHTRERAFLEESATDQRHSSTPWRGRARPRASQAWVDEGKQKALEALELASSRERFNRAQRTRALAVMLFCAVWVGDLGGWGRFPVIATVVATLLAIAFVPGLFTQPVESVEYRISKRHLRGPRDWISWLGRRHVPVFQGSPFTRLLSLLTSALAIALGIVLLPLAWIFNPTVTPRP